MLAITPLLAFALAASALPTRMVIPRAQDVAAQVAQDAQLAKRSFNNKRRALPGDQDLPVRLVMLRRREAAKNSLLVPVTVAMKSPIKPAASHKPAHKASPSSTSDDPYDWSYISTTTATPAQPTPTTQTHDPYAGPGWNWGASSSQSAVPSNSAALNNGGDDAWGYHSSSAQPLPTDSIDTSYDYGYYTTDASLSAPTPVISAQPTASTQVSATQNIFDDDDWPSQAVSSATPIAAAPVVPVAPAGQAPVSYAGY